MYAGHAAMGVALLRAAPAAGRPTAALLVGASLAADIAWCVLTLAGIEGGRSLGSQAFHAPRLPWSHSLLSTAVLAVACALVALLIADGARRRVALLAAAAVVAHWLAGDVPFGEAFPLVPWEAPLATPHLYARPTVAFALEAIVVAGGVAIALPVLGRRRAAALAGALFGLHMTAWLPSVGGKPPVDLDAEPLKISAYLLLLLAAWLAAVVATPRETPLP